MKEHLHETPKHLLLDNSLLGRATDVASDKGEQNSIQEKMPLKT